MTQALRVALHVPVVAPDVGDVVMIRQVGAPGAANETEWEPLAGTQPPIPWATPAELLAGTASELAIDPATHATMLRAAPTTPAADAGHIPVLDGQGLLPTGFIAGTLNNVLLDGGTF